MKTQKPTKALNYPFPAPKSMAEMMEFVHQPGWHPQINLDRITKMTIATNNEGKVLCALRFLNLIDEHGVPTKEFDEITKNYQPTLKRLTQEKYSDLFATLPPKFRTRQRIKDFFGKKQTDERRARFFIWLCKEAGIELPNLESELPTKKA
jgi:hypothetical protein